MKKYWLSPDMSWKTYKLLHDKIAPKDSGPTPKNLDKILWEMLKERKINIYITSELIDSGNWFPVLEPIPKNANILCNPTK